MKKSIIKKAIYNSMMHHERILNWAKKEKEGKITTDKDGRIIIVKFERKMAIDINDNLGASACALCIICYDANGCKKCPLSKINECCTSLKYESTYSKLSRARTLKSFIKYEKKMVAILQRLYYQTELI
jgi:hypothetical protein